MHEAAMLNTTDDADGSDGVKRMRLEDTNRTFELLALGGVWSSYGFFYLEEMEWNAGLPLIS